MALELDPGRANGGPGEDDLRSALEHVQASAERATEAALAAEKAADRATLAANHAITAIQGLGLQNQTLRRDFGVLWRRVHGSDPPPPTGDPHAAPPEVAGEAPLDELVSAAHENAARAHEKASSASLELAALEGRVIAGFATLATELRAQSKNMGLHERGLAFLATKEGQRVLLQLFAAAAAISAAISSCYGGH